MPKLLRVEWDGEGTAAANAKKRLPALASEYFAHVREALNGDPPPEKLHRLRLATKRLRYTLELFRPCYGPGLDARLAALRRVQQVLGEVNDCVATARLLPKRARAQAWLANHAAEKAREFRRHWGEEFDAPGREAQWVKYLARNAR